MRVVFMCDSEVVAERNMMVPPAAADTVFIDTLQHYVNNVHYIINGAEPMDKFKEVDVIVYLDKGY